MPEGDVFLFAIFAEWKTLRVKQRNFFTYSSKVSDTKVCAL